MGEDFFDDDVRQVLSLTRFHVLSSLGALEESRLQLAESQRKIIMSQRVLAKSDALIRALRSDLQLSEEREPR
jgi:hypothetical protein